MVSSAGTLSCRPCAVDGGAGRYEGHQRQSCAGSSGAVADFADGARAAGGVGDRTYESQLRAACSYSAPSSSGAASCHPRMSRM
jgi:hypothetical protein